MEVERVGPLSYTVDPAGGETNVDRPIIVGILTAVALLIAGLVGGWFLLGIVADAKLVSRGIPLLVVVVPVALAAWLARRHKSRARRNAIVVVLAAGLLAGAIVNRSLATVKAAKPQVRHAIDVIHVPGYRVISEQTFGDRFCHHGCPRVVRRYAAPGDVADPVAAFIAVMFDHGWAPPEGLDAAGATVADKGELSAQLTEREPHVVEVVVQRNG